MPSQNMFQKELSKVNDEQHSDFNQEPTRIEHTENKHTKYI